MLRVKNKAKLLKFLRSPDIPVFRMSSKNEEIGLRALREFKMGKTHEITDIDDYLNKLSKDL